MFDNVQSASNSRTNNSDLNLNLFEGSYGASESSQGESSMGNTISQADNRLTNWTNDGTRFNLGGDSLHVPSLYLTDFADPTFDKLQAWDNGTDLAQAPTDKEQQSARVLDALTKYAGDNNLAVSNLDAVGVNTFTQAWQRVFDNCPKDGQVKETVTGGQLTGQTTVGADGRRIPSTTGESVDRYYKNDDGFYYHTHTVNTMNTPGDLERVMETANHTKVYVYNQLPANGEVRIGVILPDGKSGVQINAQSSQLKEVLKRINEAEKASLN